MVFVLEPLCNLSISFEKLSKLVSDVNKSCHNSRCFRTLLAILPLRKSSFVFFIEL